MWNEPIHVLGAGSIGLLWTASIRSKFPKYPITVLLRDHAHNRTKVATAAGGTQHSGDHRLDISWNNHRLLRPVVAQSNGNEAASTTQQQQQLEELSLPVQFIHDPEHDQEKIQTLIVATKAHQAKNAVQSILDRLLLPAAVAKKDETGNGEEKHDRSEVSSSSSTSPRQTQIIVLCNGALSVREELSKILPPHATGSMDAAISLSLATTTHGAYLSETHRNRLVHAGVGTTFLEEEQQPTHVSEGMTMVDLWNHAGLKCTSLSSEQMQSMLWNKLAANCVINPLTAIFRCTNGDLLLEPSFPQLQEEILAEVAGVARGVAEKLDDETESPAETLVPTMEEMRTFVQQTIRDTRNNKSSMYQDLIVGNQRKTEIDHLNGYVVRKGREMGKDCPANEDLCVRIAALSAQNNSNRKP